MKKFILNIWYTIMYQFDQYQTYIPDWWYDNKPFDELPVKIQRIKVAKDVILQLEKGPYSASTGNYIRYVLSKDGSNIIYWNMDIKSNFEEIKDCEVCALGACLLSTTKFKNKLKFTDISQYSFESNGSKVQKLLLSIFTPFQLALIEGTFEGGYRNGSKRVAKSLSPELKIKSEDVSEELEGKMINFYREYTTDNKRLKAIMQNIIDNKGEFKL